MTRKLTLFGTHHNVEAEMTRSMEGDGSLSPSSLSLVLLFLLLQARREEEVEESRDPINVRHAGSKEITGREEMVPVERTKKKIQPWRKSLFLVSLFFILGCFMGFAPSSSGILPAYAVDRRESFQGSPNGGGGNLRREPPARKLLIAVTTIRKEPLKSALLRRTADALALVPQPLLWIIVEPLSEIPATAELLRKTTVMYRHLPSNDSFTDRDPEEEVRHQRNLALKHIETHRLDGIVHFAPISAVYDLRLFDDIRKSEGMIGAWSTAEVAANEKTVAVDGPICKSSRVVGWRSSSRGDGGGSFPSLLDFSSLAFNSSILWRRNSSLLSSHDISQDSIGFVQQMVREERSRMQAMPSDCSRIMTWRVRIP